MGNALKLSIRNSAPAAAYENLFGSDNPVGQITMLSIGSLHDYPNQPFRPYHPDKLCELAENIKLHGVMEPVIVRPYAGQYQILAGHNRTNAARLAGQSEVPCFIKEDCDDDMAALIVVDSNLNQRDELLHSEKAFAYRLQLEAMKRQGQRNDLTSDPMERKLIGKESREILAAQVGESRAQISRYIRLTELVSPLLNMVDSGKIPFRAGVNLSYATQDAQSSILSFMDKYSITSISLNQSEHIKRIENIDEYSLLEVFNLVKRETGTTVKLGASSKNVLRTYFNERGFADDEIADILDKALKQYFAENS